MSKFNQILYKWMLPNTFFQKLRYYIENISGKASDFQDDKVLDRNTLVYESASSLSVLYSPLIKLNKI